MVQAIRREIFLQKNYLDHDSIQTLYFGGGTPSLLSVGELSSIMEAIRVQHDLSQVSEVTLEANPDDLTTEKLVELKATGITRLSIGIQSFQDSVLRLLNRSHNTQTGIDAFERARKVGFSNISIDLIYAIPDVSLSEWDENVQRALALNPEHISAYTLTIEPNTVFGRWATKGKLKSMPDDVAAQQMELLVDRLETGGYDHYEVSNFSRPDRHSQHNSNYWCQGKYLGVGPSAHSYNGTSRQFNVSNNHLYLRALQNDNIPFELEVLTENDKINEYIMTSLRTKKGCNMAMLLAKFNFNFKKKHEGYLNRIIADGLAQLENDTLTLTRPGRLLADKIALDLFEVNHDG